MNIQKSLKKTVTSLMTLKLIRRAVISYAWNKRYKEIYNNEHFKLNRLSLREKKEYIHYWKTISPCVSIKTIEISKSLAGSFDKRIVPEVFFLSYIEPILNNDQSTALLQNKSIYNKWFTDGIFPKCFFHKINGRYFSHDFTKIDNINKYIDSNIQDSDLPCVIKPSKDTTGGEGVHFVHNIEEIKRIIKLHPDLVVQEKVQQSSLISEIIQDSVNTVRICLYKDKTSAWNVLNSNIRMGKDGSLDNESAGGIVCNIRDDGYLNDYAVDKFATKYFSHPNSGYVFKGKKLPYYEDLIQASKNVASQMFGVRLISLDMALDDNNNWRCIEVNLFGQTMRFAQYAGQPFFSKFTDEIISEVAQELSKD